MFHSMFLPSSLSSFLVAPFPFTFFLSHSLFLSYKFFCLQLFLLIICLLFIFFFPYPCLLTVFIGFGCLLFFLSAFFVSHSLFLSYKFFCLQLFLLIICLLFIFFFPYPCLLTVFIGFGCLLFFLSAFISFILLSHLRICLLNSIYISPISSRAFLSFRVPSFFTVPCHLHGMSLLQAVHGSTDMLRNHTSGSSFPTISLTKCRHVDVARCDTQVNYVIQNNGL